MLLGLPRGCSASGMFTEARTDGFHAIIRKKMASLLQRLRSSSNSILEIILSEKYPLFESNRLVTKTDDRIVGGEETNIEDHPYQVSFIANNSFFCGAFIVSPNYILTAGHCAQNVDPSLVVLRAGSSYRQNGTIIRITEIVPHPEYDNPPYDKDVAYMKTAEPIQFSDTIQPIALPPLNRPVTGDIVVTGWGRTQASLFIDIF
nr:trypsin 3A1-like [Maniola hyperantus]